MAKSPEEIRKQMLANLKDTTGKTLPEWLKLIQAAGAVKHGEIMKLLKGTFGVSHGYANQIALAAVRPADAPQPGSDDLINAQYAGAKAALRPIYDACIKAVSRFGTDVEIAPKKAYVSLRRSKQFAIIQPSTATRLDIGIQLKGRTPTPRLERSGSFNAMVSHRVRVESAKEIDAELIGWLRHAYQEASS
jgi:hypothetical protein